MPLPFEVERKLADGFAYIASYDVGVGFVTAAAIETSVEPPSLVVRLAANEGIRDCAFDATAQILEELRTCGRDREVADTELVRIPSDLMLGSSRQQCEEEILDTIVRLNKNKIYSRIGSKLYKKPDFVRSDLDPLSIRFREFVQRERKRTHQERADLATLLQEIIDFQDLVDVLERSTSRSAVSKNEVPVAEIKAIIKQACRMSKGKISIRDRLQAMGVPDAKLDHRIVREIDKLANYGSIPHGLIRIRWAKRYRPLFENPRLMKVEPYGYAQSAASLFISSKYPKRFVHAEVQLLAYYEMNAQTVLPRVIGSSKEACYLCDAFITAHGRFCVSKTHRQVSKKWTVPERRGYSNESIQRMRQSLQAVNQQVCHA